LNEALPASFSAIARGYPDYQLREAVRQSKEQRGSLPLLASRFRHSAGTFALESQSASAVAALDENFTWSAEGDCLGVCSSDGENANLRPPVWLPREWDAALHHRTTPLYLNQGFPLTLEEEFEFLLPANVRSPETPGLRKNEVPPLRWRVGWTKLADDKLRFEFRAELSAGELSAADTPAFQKQLGSLLNALAEGARFSLNR